MSSALGIAVVGAGPTGPYAAEELWARRADVPADALDRVTVPFGLDWYGIAWPTGGSSCPVVVLPMKLSEKGNHT
jgi:hypothetical protein